MGSRFFIAVSVVVLATMTGCAAQMAVMRRPTLGTIRGTLQLRPNGGAWPLASALGGGGHRSATADSPEDAVIYIDELPQSVSGEAHSGTIGHSDNESAGSAKEPAAATEKPESAAEDSANAPEKSATPAQASAKEATPTNEATSAKPGSPGKPASAAKSRAAAAKTTVRSARKSANRSASKPAPILDTGASGEATSPELVTMGQANHRFIPRVLPVPVGTTVHFQNRDRIYQNVFSISRARRFDVGKYAPGQSRSVKFDTPGVVQLYCDIDPKMAGFIIVVPTSFYTQPDALGAFEIPNLHPGPYTLKVWHPRLGKLTQRVELPKRGDASVTLRF